MPLSTSINEKKEKHTFQFPEVRVVEASAGSGKTYTLAKRYIQLLFDPSLAHEQIPIKKILAITFTNKAAFEMKERILQLLKAMALNQLSAEEQAQILESLSLDSVDAQRKAFLIMEDIVRHYNFFQVETIDKFVNALLSGCAFKIGLTANFRIKTTSQEYLKQSLDQLIDSAHSDKNIYRIFEEFLHHYLYLENRTGWFPKDDMLKIIVDFYRQYNYYGIDFTESMIAPEDVIKRKKAILKDMKTIQERLPPQTHKIFKKALDNFLENNTGSFDIDTLKSSFVTEKIPLIKGAKEIPRDLLRLWTRIRKNMATLCQEEASSLFNPYVTVFNLVKSGMHRLASRDDVVFLEELNKKAGLLFDEEYMTVEELYYRLATRFRHYLIDEFQDTSRIQWRNLEKMIEEALSTGGSLFYVGDSKQAIYGFRGGEVHLFEEIKERFYAFGVQIDPLTKNWRSQRHIVEFNNAVFSPQNLRRFIEEKQRHQQKGGNKHTRVVFKEDDMEEILEVFKQAQQTYVPENKKGYVRIEYAQMAKKEEREKWIRDQLINLMKELRGRFDYKDIAILTRTNQQVEELTHWLLEEGFPVESERTSDIQKNMLIQEIIAFLKFLNSPIDNLSFVHFILGEIFSKATGSDCAQWHHFVFQLRDRLQNEKGFYIYREFRQRYPHLWDKYFDDFFKNVGLYPLYELVVSLYHRFDCSQHFQDYQGFFMHFLRIHRAPEGLKKPLR